MQCDKSDILLSSQSIGVSVGFTEKTDSSIVAYWTVFTELLPGNILIKYNMIYAKWHNILRRDIIL
jgi:hypothetical protein